jgi:NAD(P)-dependent dehydrogenase (short-subunit alcohol dehydrogenase family)
MAIPFSFDDIPDQTGRTAVITGATSGLGLIAATQLAARGARVIMAVRDTAKADRVRAGLPGAFEVQHLDVADLDSVRRFAATLHDRGDGIDLLLNNAGIGAQARQLSPQGHERVLATNHLGHFALTGLLLDLFRPDHDPRIVTVGSNFYRRVRLDFADLDAARSYSPGLVYARSKLANVLFGAELDRRLRRAGSPVRSLLAHPGMAGTAMTDTAEGVVQRAFLVIVGGLLMRTAELGTLPLLFAATSPAAETGVLLGPSLRKTDTKVYFAPIVRAGADPVAAARLWSVSQELTEVRYLTEVAPVTSDITSPAAPRTARPACETR